MPIDPSDLVDIVTSLAIDGSTDHLDRLSSAVGLDVSGFGRGEGELDAVVMVLLLPRSRVQAMLPLGLELAPNPLSPPDAHPVFVQLSHDRFSFGDMDYDETMLGVPYVQLSTFDAPRRGPFVYMPRLYLNAELPRRLGVYLYGYEKLEAVIDRELPELGATAGTGHYRVRAPGGAPLCEATITPEGPMAAPSSVPAFAKVRQLFEMPLISQSRRIWDPDAARSKTLSAFLASNLVYHFDAPDAQLQPVGVKLRIHPSFTPAGLAGEHHASSLLATTLGAFRVRVRLGVALPTSPATLRYPVPKPSRRQRVLVLGGGPAACAAAYWLARQKERYEVHLYTQGFRLGGKCAAGRNPRANMRIEEHGLHAFLGHYENAFRTMRSVYQTAGIPLERDGEPFGGAFIGSNQNGLMIELDGQWKYFRTPLKTNDRVPGRVPEDARADDDQDLSVAAQPTMAGMGELMVAAFAHAARQTHLMHERNAEASRRLAREVRAPENEGVVRRLIDRIKDKVVEVGESISDAVTREPPELLQFIGRYLEDRAEVEIGEWLAEGRDGPLSTVLRFCRLVVSILDRNVAKHPGDDEVWYRWMNLSTILTAIAGIIEDRVTHLSQLDGEDAWHWMKRHGLDPRLLPEELRDPADRSVPGGQPNGSPALAGVYETLFAHSKDRAAPREMATGVALRWMFLTALGYAGHPAYFFRYSAPQTLMTPYYRALTEALGAKVHFFHRVTELVVEGTGPERRLVSVKLQRQATVAAGSDAYDPFLPDPPASNPADQPPWPIEPNYDQLVEGEALREQKVDLESPYDPWPGVGEVELRSGEDFDVCILGIPIGALPPITRALWSPDSSSHDPRWTRMLEDMAVIQTLSMQLWFDVPESELYTVGADVDGYTGEGRGLLTGYVNPEPSMGDETHLIPYEGWPKDRLPKFLAYHTGSYEAVSAFGFPPYDDHEYPARRDAWWRAEARTWLEHHHAGFYDRAPRSWPAFLACLSRPSESSPNADRLDVQYFNSGALPSDHYVLSQPKGMKARMGQMDSGVADLYLCGDWTRTDLSCGCVEAATQSGMLVARALSGHPVFVWHPGF
ncbi:NAD(P)-binding protein [Paraliomyxa miuraensis]|uniref:NAD(P)-binding protein n=1 Tax=Paraliomyxa miuraensis TaxID=376150 RepID=UPI0022515403|nr:NAD(P)-binding protein [Paraliomyxa miuraensis]MCX4240665.1 NAD(P)-binding protein [Paraliomyxa miuraensis]